MKIKDDFKNIEAEIRKLPEADRAQAIRLLIDIEDQKNLVASREEFMPFIKRVWPAFIGGSHHAILADAFERVASGKTKRLIINLPPRHTKSEFASLHFPAWYIGRHPSKKIIQASHTAELAVDFGRKVRNLINRPEYSEIFPDVSIAADSKAAGRWNTNKDGNYFAVGVGGAMTGKGADILIIDDPIDEQTAQAGVYNPSVYDNIYSWYVSGPRQRLQPGAAIILIQTRWSKRDLTGQILQNTIKADGDEWEVIQLPAILPSGKPLWPEFWPLDQLLSVKSDIPVANWNAQYMQDPTSEEGALIKREWWRLWEKSKPPPLEAIIQSWDTAFTKTDRSNYSACTTWGIFQWPDETGKDRPNLILLDAFKDKYEFPELKQVVLDSYREWEPDQLVVEKRASGAPLIFELRHMGIPVTEFTPSRGQDKITRVNAITDLFASGFVWRPDKKWADEVIEECAAFPAGVDDDYVDSTSQALLRFRQGGWIGTALDEEEDEPVHRQPMEYY